MHLGQWALNGHVQSFRGLPICLEAECGAPIRLATPKHPSLKMTPVSLPCHIPHPPPPPSAPPIPDKEQGAGADPPPQGAGPGRSPDGPVARLRLGHARRGAAGGRPGGAMPPAPRRARRHCRSCRWGAGRADFDLVDGGVDGAGRAKFCHDASVLLGPPPTSPRPPGTNAEPYTQSVRKKARRISRAAAGFATSRLGMPSATKPRRQ